MSSKLQLQSVWDSTVMSLRPSWPPSVKDIAIWGSVATVGVGITAYAGIRLFADWLIDFYMLAQGFRRFSSLIGKNGENSNLMYVLEKRAAEEGNKPFLLFQDKVYTYAECNSNANRYARALREIGVTAENLGDGSGGVAILMENSPQFLFLYYSCLRLKLTVSLMNTGLKSKGLIHCIREAKSKVLVVDNNAALLSELKEVKDELQSEDISVFVLEHTDIESNSESGGRGQERPSDGFRSMDEVLKKCSGDPVNPSWVREVKLDDVACYIFTSGTTGLPKAVKILNERFPKYSSAATIQGVKKSDTVYSSLPLYHTMALAYHNATLLIGGKFAFARKFSASGFWNDCKRHNATVITYIGELCRYLVARPPSPDDRNHSVRMAAGAGLKRDIWTMFKERFNIPRIAELYSATESNLAFMNMRNKTGSCGRHMPFTPAGGVAPMFVQYDTELEEIVRDSDGFCVEVPLGTPGLLLTKVDVVNNPNSKFASYTNKEQTSHKIVKNVKEEGDMYFNTGDILLMDTDYHIYFIDRIGDTFRWKGENVSTQEVANFLTDQKFVEDCTVYGVVLPHSDGKCGMAAFTLRPGYTVSPDLLRSVYSHAELSLAAFAHPVFIRFLSQMTLTGTFKHQKVKLKQEGYDIQLVDEVYMSDSKSKTYTRLTEKAYSLIQSGQLRI